MSPKHFNDFKFTVEQVQLMTQLYESGLTADEVVAGFKQIQDFKSKFGPVTSPQGSTNEHCQSGFSTQPNNNQSTNHSFVSPQSGFSSQPNNKSQSSNHSFVSPQSGFLSQDSQQDVSYQTKTPTSVKTSSAPSLVSSSTSSTHPQGETPQDKTKRGRRKKPISSVVVTDEDRDFFSPRVVELMEADVVAVWVKITSLMEKKKLQIKDISDSVKGAMSYQYLKRWFNYPNMNDKKKVGLLYEWYVEEAGKEEGERANGN